MTPEELRRDEANRWLASAAKDLNAARILAGAEPTASVFHSQQAAEKAAKAFLAYHNSPSARSTTWRNWESSAVRSTPRSLRS